MSTDALQQVKAVKKPNNLRKKTLITIVLCIIVIVAVTIGGSLINHENLATDFAAKNMAPNAAHIFGTDWLGRDMLLRTLKGLSMSIYIGMFACGLGMIIATIMGLMSATMGKKTDSVITFIVDLFLSLPHLLTIIIVCVAMGKGQAGVIIGVAVTHWTSMTRIVRAEVKQLLTSDYVHIARQMGKSKMYIATRHILPHVVPQLLVGFIATFPHAILHEASVTFLGFGLNPHEPAIGIILSESMKYLSAGYWWLAVLPGLALLIIVVLFDVLGDSIDKLLNPKSMHR
ncbi:MAG: ABC transporter permease [Clostridia bacterium]|nr:ABC transporter permease [Clostridia bacterium]